MYIYVVFKLVFSVYPRRVGIYVVDSKKITLMGILREREREKEKAQSRKKKSEHLEHNT